MNMPLTPRREFLKTALLGSACLWAAPAFIQQAWSAQSVKSARPLACNRIPGTRFQIDGWVRHYLTGVSEQWLKVAPLSNPAMLEMFRDRDRRPLREMVPWAGEFAGTYLTSAVQVWRVTNDESLKRFIADFVSNAMDPDDVPALDASALSGKWAAPDDWLPPMVLFEFEATDGRLVRLGDFASAGVGGSPYRSWLEVKGVAKTDFSRTNPLRSSRVERG